MATPNYDINYEDEQFKAVEADKNAAMSEMDQTYQGMIDQTDSYYQGLKDETQQWADKQSQLQQEQTDFTIEQIEQQKDQAHKDYLKEQSGAYKDWQKQSDQYGVNAEQMASSGMTNTGFSESSQVSMYNTYQNRVATARESYNQAVLNYNNAIKDARLQNNSILAEIAHNALTKQLELSLEGFQYKNNLILEQANKKIELDNIYYNRWQDVLNQMNTENAMKFEADQAELNRQFQTKEAELDRAHDLKIQELDQAFEEKKMQIEQNYKIAYLKAETEEKKKLLDKQHEQELAKLAKQHEYDKKLLDKELANNKAYLDYQRQTSGGSGTIGKGTGGGGSGGGSSKGKSQISRVGLHDKETGASKVTSNNVAVDLGRGPISAKELANLVATNQVTATKNGNHVTFKNNGNVKLASAQALLNKYTWLGNKGIAK
jgi:hypothetical protein